VGAESGKRVYQIGGAVTTDAEEDLMERIKKKGGCREYSRPAASKSLYCRGRTPFLKRRLSVNVVTILMKKSAVLLAYLAVALVAIALVSVILI